MDMSQPMSADQMLRALRAEGITKIVEMPGWRTHNRNHKGAWGEVHGLAIHHTAGTGPHMAQYCYDGTPALPGPLCHNFLAKDGTLYLVGNGRTNHAGTIAANAQTAILNETMPVNGTFRPDAAEPYDGNRQLYGLEIENKGDGKDPYPEAQYDVAVRWASAICRFHGWTAGSVAGHKEVTRRKIDPSFSMPVFRTRVRGQIAAKPGTKPPAGEDDDMDPIKFWGYRNEKLDAASMASTGHHVPDMHQRVLNIEKNSASVRGELAEVRTLITAILALLKGRAPGAGSDA